MNSIPLATDRTCEEAAFLRSFERRVRQHQNLVWISGLFGLSTSILVLLLEWKIGSLTRFNAQTLIVVLSITGPIFGWLLYGVPQRIRLEQEMEAAAANWLRTERLIRLTHFFTYYRNDPYAWVFWQVVRVNHAREEREHRQLGFDPNL